jgi:biotin carboxylase
MAKALVTFARNRIGYTITKSLAEKGIPVLAADSIGVAMTYYSRYASGHVEYPDYHKEPTRFIESLLRTAKEHGVQAIIPGHEDAYLLAANQEKFKQAGIGLHLPTSEQIALAHDKNRISEFAEAQGLLVPKTYRFQDLKDFKAQLKTIKRYPVVIKLTKTRGGIGYFKAANRKELEKAYQETVVEFGIKKSADMPIVQDYIDGYGLGVSMLFDHGKVVASFTHKRLWEYPPEGGFSVERTSTHHREAEAAAKKLLTNMNWNGVAMVEFRVEHATDKPWFLEINPRFWGSLNQAVRAGVDFPYLVYQLALGKKVEPVTDYKVGVRTRWLAGMLVGLPAYLRRPVRWKYLGSLARLYQPDLYYDDFSINDPMPFLAEFVKPVLDILSGKSLRKQDLEEVQKEYK